MYFVDQQEIEDTLLYIESLLMELKKNAFHSFAEKLALERMLHMLIESIIDIGNKMIDGFIMRDPGSYEDIIEILIDEKVLPEPEKNQYIEIIRLRNMLVKEYLTIDHEQLQSTFSKNKDALDDFSTHIRDYLKNEHSVANAFSKKLEGDER